MRLVIQRVTKASVTAGDYKSEIKRGLFVLFGAGVGDTEEKAAHLAQKLFKMRLMRDSENKMNLTVGDVDGEFLVVSQFTLYGDTSRGNRPSFVNAMHPVQAEELYLYFVEELRKLGVRVKTGSFGNYMNIDAQLDGPVTILLEK